MMNEENPYSASEVVTVANDHLQKANQLMFKVLLYCVGGYIAYIFFSSARGESPALHQLVFSGFMLLFGAHAFALIRIFYAHFLLREAKKMN